MNAIAEYLKDKPVLLQGTLDSMEAEYNKIASDIEAARARIAQLEGALRPFARIVEHLESKTPDSNLVMFQGWIGGEREPIQITIGDLRAAKAVLENKP